MQCIGCMRKSALLLIIVLCVSEYCNHINIIFFFKSIKIGVDFALKVLNWDDKTLIRLQLWDIAGKFMLILFLLL